MLEIFDLVTFATVDEGYFCTGLKDVITLLGNFVKLLQWIIPMGLILFGLIDLGKAVIAGKEDEMKKAQGTLIKRVIYAVATFLIVTIVYFVMGMVGSDEWRACWEEYGAGKRSAVPED